MQVVLTPSICQYDTVRTTSQVAQAGHDLRVDRDVVYDWRAVAIIARPTSPDKDNGYHIH